MVSVSANGIEVAVASSVDDELVAAFSRLIPQLSRSAAVPTPDLIRQIVDAQATEPDQGTERGAQLLELLARRPLGLRGRSPRSNRGSVYLLTKPLIRSLSRAAFARFAGGP